MSCLRLRTKPPDWEVCWDFADRRKQNAWQESWQEPYYHEVLVQACLGLGQVNWPYEWQPFQAGQYLQQARAEMQARLHSTVGDLTSLNLVA